MKKHNRLILLIALLLLPQLGNAQTSEVPAFISYQGRVLDNNGDPVGSPVPVNRTIIFRIWDHPSNTLAGNLIYSEQQTVTISEGEFSVLIGQGVGTAGSQFNYSETSKGPQGSPAVSIASAFAGVNRYLGVTVDDGSAAADNEITPRQQIVSSAFALRAREAETVVNSSIDNSALSSNAVGTANIQNSSIVSSKIATGAVTSTQIQDGGVTTTDLQNGSVTTSKLAGNIGVWSVTGNSVFRSSGSVGIGGSPSADFSVTGSSGTFRVHPSFTAGLGTVLLANFDSGSTNGPQLRFSRTGNFIDIGTNSSGTFVVENNVDQNLMAVTQTGRLGVGVSNPSYRMHVQDPGAQTGRLHIGGTGANGDEKIVSFGDGSLVYIGEKGADDTLELRARRFYFNVGNVGIGVASPSRGALEVTRSQSTSLSGGFLLQSAGILGVPSAPSGTRSVSIYATNDIVAPVIRTISDARVKDILGASDHAADLATLMDIEITNYRYKDAVSQGAQQHKKLIAQQVEAVYPQAVTRSTDIIPDIYAKAQMRRGWIALATDLQAGERVRIVAESGDSVVEVMEVAAGKFRTTLTGDAEVFVYGHEVEDFRSVDYDAIAMLNVSATQALQIQVDTALRTLRAENTALTEQVAAQAAEIAELKALQQRQTAELAQRAADESQRERSAQAIEARLLELEAVLQALQARATNRFTGVASTTASE